MNQLLKAEKLSKYVYILQQSHYMKEVCPIEKLIEFLMRQLKIKTKSRDSLTDSQSTGNPLPDTEVYLYYYNKKSYNVQGFLLVSRKEMNHEEKN